MTKSDPEGQFLRGRFFLSGKICHLMMYLIYQMIYH